MEHPDHSPHLSSHTHTFTNAQHHLNTHGQVFQLQLTDRVVGFDVFRDKSEPEVCILEDGVSFLPLRPVLSTFDLKVHARQCNRKRESPQRGKQDILAEGAPSATSSSPILSLWLGSASPRRDSSAPTPSPRNCHTCSEGVPALREKTDFYPQISR